MRIADYRFGTGETRFLQETWFLNGHNGRDDDQGRKSAIQNPK
ncbi:MAG: hypothetical protein QME81_01720 [bacterium]|nr:hypothetical protein [bacterium]